MRKIVSYILLFFYLALQLKPLTLIAKDAISHTFFKMQHLATVHYENGHYHLHAELKTINDLEKDTHKTAQKSSNQKTESNTQQLLSQIHFNFKTNFTLIPINLAYNSNIHSGFVLKHYLPPKTISSFYVTI